MLIDELFRQVFDSAPVGFAILDRRHRILRTNPALDRIIGHSPEPGSAYPVIPGAAAHTLRAYIETVFQTGHAPDSVCVRAAAQAGGEVRDWHCTFAPIAGDTGARVELCLACVTDLGPAPARPDRPGEPDVLIEPGFASVTDDTCLTETAGRPT